MLEQHPVTQKALIGAGAFMFVFAAAMAGTGFMISGGFSLGDAQAVESSSPSESYLMLARSGDNRLNRADQRNALESWARELRSTRIATPATAVSLDNDAAPQPAEISDSIVAQFEYDTSVAISSVDDGADQAVEEDDPFTEKS